MSWPIVETNHLTAGTLFGVRVDVFAVQIRKRTIGLRALRANEPLSFFRDPGQSRSLSRMIALKRLGRIGSSDRGSASGSESSRDEI